MSRIFLFSLTIIATIFFPSTSQTKQIRVRYPSQLRSALAESDIHASNESTLLANDEDDRAPMPRRNWRHVGKVQRHIGSDELASAIEEPFADSSRTKYRDPIAEYTSGSMRRTRVISPRYKSIFARSKSLKGSEFIPNDMAPYTGKLATQRRQTFTWRPRQVEDFFVFS